MALKGLVGKIRADEHSLDRYLRDNKLGNRIKEKIRRGIIQITLVASILGGVSNNLNAQEFKKELTSMETIVNNINDKEFSKGLSEEQLAILAAEVVMKLTGKIVSQTQVLISQGDFYRARKQLDYVIKISQDIKDEDLLKDLNQLSYDLKALLKQLPIKNVSQIEHNDVKVGDTAVSIQIVKGKKYLTVTGCSSDFSMCKIIVDEEYYYLIGNLFEVETTQYSKDEKRKGNYIITKYSEIK